MANTTNKVAVFCLETEESREWVSTVAGALDCAAVIISRPSVAALIKAAPDVVLFDCHTGVPNQWVQVLQEFRQTPLFEATPVMVFSATRQVPAALFELRRVAVLLKPARLDEVIEHATAMGLCAQQPLERDEPVSIVVDRRAAASTRPKSDKFRILDSPRLLENDLRQGAGRLGCAVLYLDIDHFKRLNTQHLEREVDRNVLGPFQLLLCELVSGSGYVYAEGGDEVVIWLPNASQRMAEAFAETVREVVERTEFVVNECRVRLTVSIGLATAPFGQRDLTSLPDAANAAKRSAKERGRNRVALGVEHVTPPPNRLAERVNSIFENN